MEEIFISHSIILNSIRLFIDALRLLYDSDVVMCKSVYTYVYPSVGAAALEGVKVDIQSVSLIDSPITRPP